jgi:hypothetical protein
MRERRDRHPVNTQRRQTLPICKRCAIRKGGLVIRRAAWAAPRAVLGFASVAWGLGWVLSGLGVPDFVFYNKIRVFNEIKTFFKIKYNTGAGISYFFRVLAFT